MNSEKNYAMEFYRFLFAMIIAIAHFAGRCEKFPSDVLDGGYLAVEFFFVLSGFLLMHKYYHNQPQQDKQSGEEAAGSALKFLISKLKRLYPHYCFSFLALLIYTAVFIAEKPINILLKDYFWEILMLNDVGIMEETLNSPTWYISAMMVASYVIYYLVNRTHKQFCYLIAPLSVISIYVYFSNTNGHIGIIQTVVGCTTGGMLRAFSGLCVGCIFYELYCYILPYGKKKMRIVLTVVEGILYYIILSFMLGNAHSTDDFMLVILMGVAIASTFIGESFLSKLLNNPVSKVLGRLSYPIYLNQWLLILIIKNNPVIASYSYQKQLGIYLGLLFGVSCLTELLCRYWPKQLKKIGKFVMS